jgi:nitronate monooxygenase
MNLWVPDPAPLRDVGREAEVRRFLEPWNPGLTPDAGDAVPLDFEAQCEAILSIRPPIVSTIMGVFPDSVVTRLKAAGIKWFATATTVTEARRAEAAGADAIIAQGMEAGGHRGAFEAAEAEANLIGLFALLPAVADTVRVPVIATGGIADARGIAAALALGASAVQIGTGFMRCPEAELPAAWSKALGAAAPEDTQATRAFSGRLGRGLATAYVKAAAAPEAPAPAPYPVQRGLTRAMSARAARENDLDRMQAWAGQSARLAQARPAGDLLTELWQEAQALLP